MAIFEKRNVSLTSPPQWLMDYLGVGETVTGESITVEGSLSVPAVLSAFTILSEDVSSLPLILYRRLERGKERATDNPLYTLLHDAPNPEHTSMVFRELLMGHLLGWGNFYSQIIYDNRGRAAELWPLDPSRMEVFRENGERKYLYTQTNGSKRAFRSTEIWHIPAFGFDGLVGYSRVALARNSISTAVSAEKYAGRIYQNDARPSVVLKHPGVVNNQRNEMTDQVYNRLKANWNQSYQGASNAGKVAILEDGMDIATIGFPPKDAAFIDSQTWSAEQIARVFRVPPHMLGLISKSTSWGSGIEQQEQGYISHTLRPWLVRIEQQANKDILLQADRNIYFYEHLTDGFLRSDTTARFAAYAQAITNGWMTRNEARERENLNPLDGLDDPLIPLNMQSADEADQPDPEPEPMADSPSDDGSDPSDGQRVRPFVLDIVRRAIRRETNEITDAIKRTVGKDKSDKFLPWLEQFYKQDHPDYLVNALAPLGRDVRAVVQGYCQLHGDQLFRAFADGDSVDVLVSDFETLAEQVTDAILEKENE